MRRLDDRSWMSGDVHVRFCESLRGRFPLATRLGFGFQYESEGRTFLKALCERVEAYGLKLHPVKTRLIEFGRFAVSNRSKRRNGKPETLNWDAVRHHVRRL